MNTGRINSVIWQQGNIKHHLHKLADLTSDQEVLDTIIGLPLRLDKDFETIRDHQTQYSLGRDKQAFRKREMQQLLDLGAIGFVPMNQGTPIFVRLNDDGSFGLVVNLKRLNENTEFIIFEVDALGSIKVYINDAYYSVPIYPPDQKLHKFMFVEALY